MPVLVVGNTDIPYVVRRSDKARRRRIIVTPEKVEVVVPRTDSHGSIHEFIHERRRWVYDKREEMIERIIGMANPAPDRLVSGAKVLFRGRYMRLRVLPANSSDVRIEYRNGFIIHRPHEASDSSVKTALREWLEGRVKADIGIFLRRYAEKLRVSPKAVRVQDFKHLWGSCGKSGIICLNWRLVAAPKPVLEYAVVHELCHLRHRNHSPAFWKLLHKTFPDYGQCKRWLDRNQHVLDRV